MLPVGSAGSVFALVLPYVSVPNHQWLLEGESYSSWLGHDVLLVDILPDEIPLDKLLLSLFAFLHEVFFVVGRE